MVVNTKALDAYLGPLKEIFNRQGVAEISINQPKEVWVEIKGQMVKEEIPDLDFSYLKALARLIAQYTSQEVSEENPLLSASLPQGYRVQVVFPPACEPGNVAFSIRKQQIMDLDLNSYEALGAFQETATSAKEDDNNTELSELLKDGKIKQFIEKSIIYKKNVIVSGGTSTGKTTFLNAALKAIPDDERIITIEDAREVNLDNHPNKLHLLGSKGSQGRAKVDSQMLIESCLRLRPDRIILGEIRGKEAFSFLRAINTGHPGSISSLHADSPKRALEQLVMMVMQAGLGFSREEILHYIKNVVEVIVQLKRGEKGRRFVSEVYFKPTKIQGKTQNSDL